MCYDLCLLLASNITLYNISFDNLNYFGSIHPSVNKVHLGLFTIAEADPGFSVGGGANL